MIQTLTGQAQTLTNMVLDRIPEKERLPLAGDLKTLGIKGATITRAIAKDRARLRKHGRGMDSGLGLGIWTNVKSIALACSALFSPKRTEVICVKSLFGPRPVMLDPPEH